MLLTLFFLIGALLLWRIWRFTIQPLRHPLEPPELPYWIPFLGHAHAYLKDSFSTLSRARHYFNDDRKPFSITLAGQVMYIITAPADVTAAYRNTPSLTMDVFLKDLMRGFEVSDNGLDRVFQAPEQDGSAMGKLLSANKKHMDLGHLTVNFYRTQLQPGDHLTHLGHITRECIEGAMRWENMTTTKYIRSESAYSGYKDISLLHWCEDILLRASVRTFFGDVLTDVSPDIMEHFLEFDALSWKVLYQYPKMLSGDMRAKRNKMVADIQRYFELPKEARSHASWSVQMQEEEMLARGVSIKDLSTTIGLIYWVINTNAYKLLFWMLSFLLLNPSLIAQVRTELQSAFLPDGTLDIPSLQTQTTFLTALFHETMRVSNSSSSARFITSDITIGPYTLKAGRKLLIPYRQLHLNKAVFGDNAAEFNIDRFLDDEKLASHPSYRPFGGGKTYCPGRFLAKQEIFMALAFLLCRYDVGLAPGMGQKAPRMDELKPGIGIVAPVEGDDLVMRVSRK